VAIGPISVRTSLTSSFFSSSVGSTPGHRRDVGVDALALDVVRIADHGGLGDGVVQHQRDSISAVPRRWPETLSTSSMRPVIQ
jgi:hypothetical protein